MPFQKGNKLGGRPKESAWLKHKLHQLTDANLKDALALRRDTEDDRLKWDITKWMLEMVHGRPAQAVTDGDGKALRPGIIVLPMEALIHTNDE